ncbi:hypothetical protein [Nocardia brasiliensis]|uniref:hypothetical protein n=1 Tax=Nocardia brasiliensis TaxID=37326 RepID=UPI00245762A1|nr:hypothetical protein [Nocardia brasiliensis]
MTTRPGITVISAVTKTAVTEWIDRHYKADRLNRDPGSRERIIADRLNDMQHHGRAVISRHESITGEAVWLSTDKSPGQGR